MLNEISPVEFGLKIFDIYTNKQYNFDSLTKAWYIIRLKKGLFENA